MLSGQVEKCSQLKEKIQTLSDQKAQTSLKLSFSQQQHQQQPSHDEAAEDPLTAPLEAQVEDLDDQIRNLQKSLLKEEETLKMFEQ